MDKQIEEYKKIYEDIIATKDNIIKNKDKRIALLERRLDLATKALGDVYRAYKEYEDNIGD